MAKPKDIWFIFPGMGRPWEGLDQSILNLQPFRDSIEFQAQILKLFHVDLYQLLFPNQFQQKCPILQLDTVCITSVQIAFIDLLKSFNIHPTGIVGHSIGEIACAYADGCSTSDETIKIAYAHALACRISTSMPGSMISVGLSAEAILERLGQRQLSKQLYLACYNSPDNVTISGPESDVASLARELQEESVFVKNIYCAGLAHHTELIQVNVDKFEKNLKTVVDVTRKLRSNRWKSSSVCETAWHSNGKFYSSDYLVNNMVKPVLFQQALDHVPDDAIVVEISSFSTLQCVLRQCLPNCRILPLGVKRLADDLVVQVHRSIKEVLRLQPDAKIQILVERCFGYWDDNSDVSRSMRNEIILRYETSAIEFFVNLILRKSNPQNFRVAQVINSQSPTVLLTVRRCALLSPTIENLELHIITNAIHSDLEDSYFCPEIFAIGKICINFMKLQHAKMSLDLLILDKLDFSALKPILEKTQYVLLKGNTFSKNPPGFKCFVRKRVLNEHYILFQKSRFQNDTTLF